MKSAHKLDLCTFHYSYNKEHLFPKPQNPVRLYTRDSVCYVSGKTCQFVNALLLRRIECFICLCKHLSGTFASLPNAYQNICPSVYLRECNISRTIEWCFKCNCIQWSFRQNCGAVSFVKRIGSVLRSFYKKPYVCVKVRLEWLVTYLTFKNRASYIYDGRTANLQMLHFIYFFQQL